MKCHHDSDIPFTALYARATRQERTNERPFFGAMLGHQIVHLLILLSHREPDARHATDRHHTTTWPPIKTCHENLCMPTRTSEDTGMRHGHALPNPKLTSAFHGRRSPSPTSPSSSSSSSALGSCATEGGKRAICCCMYQSICERTNQRL